MAPKHSPWFRGSLLETADWREKKGPLRAKVETTTDSGERTAEKAKPDCQENGSERSQWRSRCTPTRAQTANRTGVEARGPNGGVREPDRYCSARTLWDVRERRPRAGQVLKRAYPMMAWLDGQRAQNANRTGVEARGPYRGVRERRPRTGRVLQREDPMEVSESADREPDGC